MESISTGPSRRSLTKGLAWTAPVLVGGAAAPVVAASPGPRSRGPEQRLQLGLQGHRQR